MKRFGWGLPRSPAQGQGPTPEFHLIGFSWKPHSSSEPLTVLVWAPVKDLGCKKLLEKLKDSKHLLL